MVPVPGVAPGAAPVVPAAAPVVLVGVEEVRKGDFVKDASQKSQCVCAQEQK